jgi:hydroxymethylbilane synthase
MKTIKIATRKTPLALKQTEIFIQEFSKKFPEIKCEVIEFTTTGDKKLSSLLTESENFFTKELENSLIQKKVDCAVHSLKDTAVIRPFEIQQLAFLKRGDVRDLIIISKDFIENIKQKKEMIFASCSPRRSLILTQFLRTALNLEDNFAITIAPIRGGVETRLKKVGKEFDGTALAKCGLDRLNLTSDIERQFFVITVPVSAFASAPGQGCIVIEGLKGSKFENEIKSLNHKETELQVSKERDILKKFGGGCHQQFGVTDLSSIGFKSINITGKNAKGEDITKRIFPEEELFLGQNPLVISSLGCFFHEKIFFTLPNYEGEKIFISNAKAINNENTIEFLKGKKVYTSGYFTWQKLAKMGIMVQECFEGKGFEKGFDRWIFFTHLNSKTAEEEGLKVVRTYKISLKKIPEIGNDVTGFFWHSSWHFELLEPFLKERLQILPSGSMKGKTSDFLAMKNLKIQTFESDYEFKKK